MARRTPAGVSFVGVERPNGGFVRTEGFAAYGFYRWEVAVRETVVVGVVAGLEAVLAAIEAGKTIALIGRRRRAGADGRPIVGGFTNPPGAAPLVSCVIYSLTVCGLFGVSALVVFGTRWRPMTEGLAAMALGIFSFLSGFSIGFFTWWVALLIGIVALIHSSAPGSRPVGVNSG